MGTLSAHFDLGDVTRSQEAVRSIITRVFWIAGALALGFAAAKGWMVKP